jgi:hypothetical protein
MKCRHRAPSISASFLDTRRIVFAILVCAITFLAGSRVPAKRRLWIRDVGVLGNRNPNHFRAEFRKMGVDRKNIIVNDPTPKVEARFSFAGIADVGHWDYCADACRPSWPQSNWLFISPGHIRKIVAFREFTWPCISARSCYRVSSWSIAAVRPIKNNLLACSHFSIGGYYAHSPSNPVKLTNALWAALLVSSERSATWYSL